jgi:adenosylmethionine-8-amino-7-oxononanoate aminotransferase
VFLSREYLQAAQELAQRHGIHLIADEVTTGVGRVGHMSYSDALGFAPDLLVLGKGLSGGYVPMSAVVTSEDVYRTALRALPLVVPHSSTNDGHPLAMAAGLAVVDALSDGSIFEHVRRLGGHVEARARELFVDVPSVTTTSGRGLMHFFDLHDDGRPWTREQTIAFVDECERRGLLVDAVYNHVFFTPPLVTTEDECDEMLGIIAAALACRPS